MRIPISAALAAAFSLLASTALAEPTRPGMGRTIERGFGSIEAPIIVSEERDAAQLDPNCVGKISAAPNYVIDVTDPVRLLITAGEMPAIEGEHPEDFTLVVRAPDGRFICNDDSGGDLRPQVVIDQPMVGRYEIWLGVFGEFTLGNEPRRVLGAIIVAEAHTAGPPGRGPGPASVTPPFPRWPPPRASARANVQRTPFASDATLGDVADRLMAALRSSGNSRASYYTEPGGGFVLVARLERIRDDARPEAGAGRFIEPRAGQSIKPDDPLDFLEALFFAPEGNYRQVMFIVSERAVVEGNWTLTTDAAGAILDAGSASLAGDYRSRPFGADHRITALIYEFSKQGGAEAVVRVPGRWTGATHLTRSGVLANLRR